MKQKNKIQLTVTFNDQGRKQFSHGTFSVENIPRTKNLTESMQRLSIFLGTRAIRHSGKLAEEAARSGSISLWQYADNDLTHRTATNLAVKLESLFGKAVEIRWQEATQEREAA